VFGPDDFWAARKCFLPPIPELDEAAELLGEAADALLAGDHDFARDRLRRADMPVVRDYATRIMGSINKDIHRYRPIEGSGSFVRAEQRKPGLTVEKSIYKRDGYRCRFCECRVVLGTARSAMRAIVPDAIAWSGTARTHHGAFLALTATIDHLKPHSKGGDSEPQNLLTTCWPCNFGRGMSLIEEVGLLDPNLRAPVLDGWDGLIRMLTPANKTPRPKRSVTAVSVLAGGHGSSGVASSKRAAHEIPQQSWFANLDRNQDKASSQLLAFLKGCEDLQVDWGLDKVLVVRMRSKDHPLWIFGILPDGSVEIPWFIGTYKQEFRAFAEAIAAAIPGTVAYETPKLWSVRKMSAKGVRKRGERILVSELLAASATVRTALEQLSLSVKTRPES
jgi:5-methylcytosine-specific restriction endonuclease McrA